MTERFYQHDSYLRAFASQVVEVREHAVVLGHTAFFPAGGGVLGDTGLLRGADGQQWPVVETVETVETVDADGAVLHRVEGTPPPPGTELRGELDWARRYALMRYHTATHVLCGVMFNDYGVRVTGNQLTPEKGRVDFSFEAFDRALLEQGFEKANAIVQRDLAVHISFLPAAEALQRPELFKLESGFRHTLDTLRLVEIDGFDVQADGGCHVGRLKEIGRLVLTKSENKGKSNRRVYFQLEDGAL